MKRAIAYTALSLLLVLCPVPVGADTTRNPLEENRVEIRGLGVFFRPIAGWHLLGQQALIKNLARYEFTEDELRRILSTHSGSRTVASFVRDDPRITSGIIPTINIIANPSRDTSEAAIRAASHAVIDMLRHTTHDVEVVEDITELTVSDMKAYRFMIEFGLTMPDGTTARISNQTYVLPRDGVLLQISMSEAIPTEMSDAFAAFINAVEIDE